MWLHEGNNAIIPLGVDSNTLHTELDRSFIFYFLTFIWQPNVSIYDFIRALIGTKKNKSLIHDNFNWNFSINIFTKELWAVGYFTDWFHLTHLQTQPEEHPLLDHKEQYFEFEANSTSLILPFNFCSKQLFCSEQAGFILSEVGSPGSRQHTFVSFVWRACL